MHTHVKTIRTQGFQLWCNKSLKELGWKLQSPIHGAFVEPIDTWADMTHLLAVEEWPAENQPQHLSYFCGVMQDPPEVPPAPCPAFSTNENERTFKSAKIFLQDYLAILWPAAGTPEKPTRFDLAALHGSASATGEARLREQYFRANIDLSERYTLAVAGSTKYRLKATESGYLNLTLTGDWIRNGLNTPGCIEGAVISGRQAGRAVSGASYEIIGEADFPREASIFSLAGKCILGFVWWILHWVGSALGLALIPFGASDQQPPR